MSQAGFVLSARARWGYKLLIGENTEQVRDALLIDGLTDPITHELMGEETERLCQAHRITRGVLAVKCAGHRGGGGGSIHRRDCADRSAQADDPLCGG